MTELERKRIVTKHRMQAAALLRLQGYESYVDAKTLNVIVVGKQPTLKEYDKTIYLAYLFVRDDEKDYGNKIELLDLLW